MDTFSFTSVEKSEETKQFEFVQSTASQTDEDTLFADVKIKAAHNKEKHRKSNRSGTHEATGSTEASKLPLPACDQHQQHHKQRDERKEPKLIQKIVHKSSANREPAKTTAAPEAAAPNPCTKHSSDYFSQLVSEKKSNKLQQLWPKHWGCKTFTRNLPLVINV